MGRLGRRRSRPRDGRRSPGRERRSGGEGGATNRYLTTSVFPPQMRRENGSGVAAVAECAVIIEPWDVRRELAELGLEIDHLMVPLRAGHTARVSRSPYDPPIMPGLTAWCLVGPRATRGVIGHRQMEEKGRSGEFLYRDERRTRVQYLSNERRRRYRRTSPSQPHGLNRQRGCTPKRLFK